MEILIFIALVIGLAGLIGNQNLMLRKMDKVEAILRELKDQNELRDKI
ncbi:hypothetical protein [Paenibacillus glycanilyticus]|nr:hypothetical protein [Paenibacillus glycanilyticus]